jgi:hypothetical protein
MYWKGHSSRREQHVGTGQARRMWLARRWVDKWRLLGFVNDVAGLGCCDVKATSRLVIVGNDKHPSLLLLYHA